MSHQLIHLHGDTKPVRPRRRWSDINPAVFCALIAAILGMVFHFVPEEPAGVRTVLIAMAAATMLLAIPGLLFMERFGGRGPDGRRHPGRRHDDWTR